MIMKMMKKKNNNEKKNHNANNCNLTSSIQHCCYSSDATGSIRGRPYAPARHDPEPFHQPVVRGGVDRPGLARGVVPDGPE